MEMKLRRRFIKEAINFWTGEPLHNSKRADDFRNNHAFDHLPDDAEIFDWDYPGASGIGVQPSVAYDAILPAKTVIHVHQMRPEDNSNGVRVAFLTGFSGNGATWGYWWGQHTGTFVVEKAGFHSIVAPAFIAVHVAAWLPMYQNETLIQVA